MLAGIDKCAGIIPSTVCSFWMSIHAWDEAQPIVEEIIGRRSDRRRWPSSFRSPSSP
jgi:hypothetical protein